MTFSDFTLLGKKILIGILIAVVPFIILFGGLLLTQNLLKGDNQKTGTKQISTNPE